MREDVKNLNELSDSRELLEARPNPLFAVFIYLLLIILVAAIIWAYFGEIEEVVKADGVVRANETISTVRNEMPRQVKRIAFSEGQHVETGEILFELDSSEEELQKEILQAEISEKKTTLRSAQLLKQSIEQGDSQFSDESESNQYYRRYDAYQAHLSLLEQERESNQLEVSENRESHDSERASIQSRKERLESRVNQLKRLRDAINDEKSSFEEEESPYYYRFLDFTSTIEQLDNTIHAKKEAYETVEEKWETLNSSEVDGQHDEVELDEVEHDEVEFEEVELDEVENGNESIDDDRQTVDLSVIEQQLREAENAYEDAIAKRDQYKNQQLVQVNSEIEQIEDDIQELDSTSASDIDFTKLEDSLDENYQASVEKFKSDSFVDITNEINDIDNQIRQLQHDVSSLEQQIETTIVRAPRSGVVNVRTNISEGDFLQPGTEILTIIPEHHSSYTVQLSVLNQDIAKMEAGDEVTFSIHSLPHEQYGKVRGEISQVSADATVDPETGVSYYAVEATIDNEPLYSHTGDEEAIKLGMTTEAHIVTDSKKILYVLLEKMHLKDER